MLRSSFAGFTTAQLALNASQSALNITGQNISNVNTVGYTRQRLDLISLNNNNASKYSSAGGNINIGYGVDIKSISQIRNPYLDVRYRTQIPHVGYEDSKLGGLNEIASVIDEVDKTGVSSQFRDLYNQLQKLSNGVGDLDSAVRSSAQSLTELLNAYSKDLAASRESMESHFSTTTDDVNGILKNIQTVSESIKIAQTNGYSALELEDERNLLIDELSTYVNIEVHHTEVAVMGDNFDPTSRKIDKMTINLVDSSGTRFSLLDIGEDDSPAQFSTEQSADGKTILSLKAINQGIVNTSPNGGLQLKTGSMKGTLDMLNCSGAFDNTQVRGIGYYEKMLDSMAYEFATSFNQQNNLPNASDHNLFESSDGGAITAGSIKISNAWLNGQIGIVCHDPQTGPSGSTDNTNVLKMIQLLDKKFDYSDTPFGGNSGSVYKGTYEECFSNMVGVLGLDQKSTTSVLKSYLSVTQEISNSRDSVSAVSLDDEATNIMQYQKAYNAAARLMTTLDEALNTIINGMGV